MRIFNRLKEPIFLKESSNAEEQLEKLKNLEPLLNKKGQAILRQDIRRLEYGIAGEKNIAFELKNSHMPMYILHDLYLEDGDLSAQIDYLVFTRKICLVIECKNLLGDIEINNRGEFIRTTNFGGRKQKEGIYSPITQNQRHLELMRKIRVDNKNNILTKLAVDSGFKDSYKSIVVLANPKTVLNSKYAKKEVKDKVIRADQLINYIKDMHEQSKELSLFDKGLLEWAQSYLNLHKEVEKDYTNKYEQYKIKTAQPKEPQELSSTIEENKKTTKDVGLAMEETEIFKELRAYRLNKSREDGIKPYIIYSNKQLKDLIINMPKNKKELQSIAGFGEVKVNKYGDDIIEIIKKH